MLGIVQNMSFFKCPSCGTCTHIFGNDGARKLAKEMDLTVLADIPLHADITLTSDTGTPITIKNPDGIHALAYKEMALKIIEKLEK